MEKKRGIKYDRLENRRVPIDRHRFFFHCRREKHFIANFDEEGLETLTFRDRSERFCLNNSSANVYSRTVVAWYDYVDVTSITCSKEYITRYIRLPLFSYSPLCWILLRVSLVVSQFETLRRIGIFVKRFGIWKKRIWIVFCINFVKLERDCDCYLTLDDTLIMISNTINRRSEEEEEEESKKVSIDDLFFSYFSNIFDY